MSTTYQPQHKFDLIPSPPDRRDFKLEPPEDYSTLTANKMLPSVPPTRDQGQEGSCWGFSGSGAHQNGRVMLGLEDTPLSPAFLYWNTRKAMGNDDEDQDSGSDLRTGLDTLLKLGNCAEDHMPYVVGRYMDPPLQAAYDDAKNRTIKEYHRLTSVNAIRYAISLNRPVVFGIPVYQAFEESQDGHVPMPLPSDQPLGGHAIQCIGYYTDANTPGGGLFVLLNSWGERAGDHGRYYIPWEYMTALGWSEAWSMTVG